MKNFVNWNHCILHSTLLDLVISILRNIVPWNVLQNRGVDWVWGILVHFAYVATSAKMQRVGVSN